MKTYLEWSEVREGDFLETPAGDFRIQIINSREVHCGVGLAGYFFVKDVEALGIKAFRREPRTWSREGAQVFDCYVKPCGKWIHVGSDVAAPYVNATFEELA